MKMRVDEIVPLHTNPPSRVVEKEVRDLIVVIQNRMAEGLSPLHEFDFLIIGKDGVLGDGHRRLAALKACGVEFADVRVDPERSAWQVWHDKACAKNLTARQVAESGKLGLPIEYYPPQQQFNANHLIRLAGEQGHEMVLRAGKSLGIWKQLTMVLNFLDVHNDKVYARKVLAWLMNHGMQKLVRQGIETGALRTAKLRQAIERDKPLRMG